jgi:hypothetical protein
MQMTLNQDKHSGLNFYPSSDVKSRSNDEMSPLATTMKSILCISIAAETLRLTATLLQA